MAAALEQESLSPTCAFCQILLGKADAYKVFEDDRSIAFLDYRPLLHGHCLLVPKIHVPELKDLPKNWMGPFFENVQLLSRAVESALDADGSFVAVNIKVSQSVPHLHVHVVPRHKKDGLFSKNFSWVRHPYASQDETKLIQQQIIDAIAEFSG